MKKNVTLWLVLIFALVFALAVPAFALELVSAEYVGVPTVYLDENGVPIYSAEGEQLSHVSQDDLVLVGEENYDEVEKQIYDELLESTDLPMWFMDKDRQDENIIVDGDDVSLTFDFMLKGDGSDVLDTTDGTVANLKFELVEEMNPGNLVVAQYINGEWMILDPEFYSEHDGLLDINLENEGMLAFFRYRKVEIAQDEAPTKSSAEEETYELVPDPYRPSVMMRAYPKAVEAEPGYYYVLETVYMNPTSAKPALKVPTEEIKLRGADEFDDDEKEAYKSLENAEKLSDVCKNLPAILEKGYPGVDEKDLVVRDVFDFNMGPTAEDYLKEHEDSCLALKFRYSIEEGDTFVVLQFVDGEWVALPAEYVEVEDGFVTVKLRQNGLLAFVVEPQE